MARKVATTKATLYWVDAWSGGPVRKLEVNLVEHGVTKYAQYDRAPYVVFYKKRARNARKLTVYGHDHYLVILKGWGHPDPDSPFTTVVEGNGVTVQKSRHLWVGGPWEAEFDAKLASYAGEVMADYRAARTQMAS